MSTLWSCKPKTRVYNGSTKDCALDRRKRSRGSNQPVTQPKSSHYVIATCVSRANRLVGLIKRTYENKSKRNIIAIYKSLVRPHLEYCVQAWRPHNQKDIDNLEGVQRRMTKMINGMGEDEYNLRLSKTKLLSLEMRRLRSDLIEVFKIMHNNRGGETRGLLPATHRHWPKRSLSDHSQTALQAECAEIFLHTSSSGYLEQDE